MATKQTIQVDDVIVEDRHRQDFGDLPRVADAEIRQLHHFPGYAVGDDGSVWSKRSDSRHWLRLKPSSSRAGYQFVRVRGAKGAVSRNVHRLVLEAFVGRRPEGMQCRHLNGNPQDNRLCNLKWGTPKENAADKRVHGTHLQGEDAPGSRLTEKQALIIRFLADAGYPRKDVADAFGVSCHAVNDIANRVTWRHVSGTGKPVVTAGAWLSIECLIPNECGQLKKERAFSHVDTCERSFAICAWRDQQRSFRSRLLAQVHRFNTRNPSGREDPIEYEIF